MRGCLGSWSPANVVGSWTEPQCPGPFQALDRGILSKLRIPSTYAYQASVRPGGRTPAQVASQRPARRPRHRSLVRLFYWAFVVALVTEQSSVTAGSLAPGARDAIGSKLPPMPGKFPGMQSVRGLLEPSSLRGERASPSPHTPLPNRSQARSTGGSRCQALCCLRRDCGSRILALPASWEGGTWSLALPQLQSWAPLVGRRLKPAIVAASSLRCPVSPQGAAGTACFSLLNWGKRCFPQTPIQSVGPVGSSLHWLFSVPGALVRSSSFSSRMLASS